MDLNRFIDTNKYLITSPCITCANKNSDNTCKKFPSQIPDMYSRGKTECKYYKE
jgi:hypothetical protein